MPRKRLSGAAGWCAVVVLLVFGTMWITRPLFSHRNTVPASSGSASLMGEADFNLNAWILAWVAHIFVDRPAGVRLFDANIFYPAHDALAGSENMLAHLPVTALVWLGGRNIALVFKAMVLESYVLTGLAMFWLVRMRTGETLAALAAASAFAFVPLRWNSFAQPQYLATQYLVVAIGALDLWIADGRRRWLALAAAGLVLQTLTCFYIGYFSFVSVGLYGLALLGFARQRTLGRFAALGLMLVLAVLVAAPVGIPYLRLRAAGALPVHRIDELVPTSMLLVGYASRLTLVPFGVVLPAGFLLACAVFATGALGGARERAAEPAGTAVARDRATWALLGAVVVLSLGPIGLLGEKRFPLPYQLLYYLVPGFSSLRAPGRFIFVVALAAALLMASALARIARRSRVLAWLLAIAAIAGDLAWSGWTPLRTNVLPIDDWQRGVYGRLAREPIDGGVLEVPPSRAEGDLVGNLRHSREMVASSTHWWPLLNGYTAYFPASYPLVMSLARELPDASALRQLFRLVALRWVVVHLDQLDPPERARWEAPGDGFELVLRSDQDLLLRVTLPDPPSRPALEGRRGARETLGGVSKAALAPACRAAGLELRAAPGQVIRVPQPFTVELTLTNRSACPWPALDTLEDGLVVIRYRWIAPDGTAYPPGARSRLLRDVAAGERLDTRAAVFPPGGPLGTYRLSLWAEQVGSEEPLAAIEVPVEVVPLNR